MRKNVWILILSAVIFVLLLIIGGMVVANLSTASKPVVVINSPPSGGQVNAGQDLVVQSTAADPKGVIRVDLIVDDVPVSSDTPPSPQTTYSVVQRWKALPGTHTIGVKAYNKDAVASEAALITIVVASPVPANVTPTARPAAPTPVPPTNAPPQPTVCANQMAFVGDVSFPDGSPVSPNQAFTKIWRVTNAGGCAWTTRFQLAHIGGERMSSAAAFAVPVNVAPGQTVDLAVPMASPAAGGLHTGQWQLRDESGHPFGAALVVKINVVAPQPTACIPNIVSFTVDRATLNRGESTVLRWNVTNAQRVEIDNGVGGVGPQGERPVAPNQSATFTLYATCDNNTQTRQVTINVIQPQPPTAEPTAAPQRRNISGQWASGNYSMALTEAMGCGGPDCGVTGSFSEWTGGTPVVATVNGTVNVLTGAVSLTIVEEMPGASPRYFNGSLSADNNRLSGQLTDVGAVTFNRQ